MEVYVDSNKGSDDTGCLNSSDKPFKTLDIAYQKCRITSGDTITFQCTGVHNLTLDTYENVKLCKNGEFFNLILKREGVKFNQVGIISSMFSIMLDSKVTTPGVVLTTQGLVNITCEDFKVIESKATGYGNNPDKILIRNDGDLSFSCKSSRVDVDRIFTFIVNNGALTSSVPNYESVGGSMYAEGENVVSTILMGTADIKINYKYTSGVITSSKVDPSFNLYKGRGDLLCKDMALTLNVPGSQPGNLLQFDGEIRGTQIMSGLSEGMYTDKETRAFLYRCTLTSKSNIKLSNDDHVKLISCQLDKVLQNSVSAPSPADKSYTTVYTNFVVDDHTPSGILVDTSKNPMKIMIPHDLKIEKLYIKKIDRTPYTVTVISSDVSETIILNLRTPCVKLFKHEGKLYVKYKY